LKDLPLEGEADIRGADSNARARLARDLSYVESSAGERVAFTRSEKRVLKVLAGQPNRLLTRDQILDAITGQGSDKSARNIDFLINRLRRKLSDDARAPRYIATRYGEGYVWIGRGLDIDADHASAYLIVGPVRGLDNLDGCRELGEAFASDLCAALRAELPPEQRAILAPDCPPPSEFTGDGPTLAIEPTFFEERGAANCVVVAREFRTGRILAIRRIAVPDDGRIGAIRIATETASALLDETWRTMATQTEAGLPLPVLLQMASAQPEPDRGTQADDDQRLHKLEALHQNRIIATWRESEARLTSLRKASPDDPGLKILYATHVHSKYITFGYTLLQKGIDDRARDEDNIESLVFAALPHVQSQPEYAITAAKLLHFVQRGHFELARGLAEEAYSASVSAAGSLAMIGQLRAFAGEIESAVRCIDQSLNLVERGSKAHLYSLTLKMQALLAAGDFARLKEVKRELYGISAAAMVFYEPVFTNPQKLSFRARAVMRMMSRDKGAAMLTQFNYVSARLFREPDHRSNAILPLLTLFTRRFGKAALPDEVAAAHPALLGHLA